MREVKLYYADNYHRPFNTPEECLKYEEDAKKRNSDYLAYSSQTKFTVLVDKLKEAMYIDPRTTATCSYDALGIKGMVRVCQSFAEEHKHYLNYY